MQERIDSCHKRFAAQPVLSRGDKTPQAEPFRPLAKTSFRPHRLCHHDRYLCHVVAARLLFEHRHLILRLSNPDEHCRDFRSRGHLDDPLDMFHVRLGRFNERAFGKPQLDGELTLVAGGNKLASHSRDHIPRDRRQSDCHEHHYKTVVYALSDRRGKTRMTGN